MTNVKNVKDNILLIMGKLPKNVIMKVVLTVWVVLWAVFLVRENKRGQYEELRYFYSASCEEKTEFLLGKDLKEFLDVCISLIPPGAEYDIQGFERFSINEVRARYYLWPLRRYGEGAEYLISYGPCKNIPDGYNKVKNINEIGVLYIKGETE